MDDLPTAEHLTTFEISEGSRKIDDIELTAYWAIVHRNERTSEFVNGFFMRSYSCTTMEDE